MREELEQATSDSRKVFRTPSHNPSWGTRLDTLTVITIGLLVFSVAVFIWFGRFTLKLIRQHRDINSLLYALEEEEKEKR